MQKRGEARKFYQGREFRKLEAEWYGKLKESGFRDLEVRDAKGRDTGMLLGVSVGDLQRDLYDPETQRYYELARAHVHRVERRARAARSSPSLAPNEVARAERLADVWSLHSEGLSNSAVGRHLGLDYRTVRRMVVRERKAMYAAESRLRREEEGATE